MFIYVYECPLYGASCLGCCASGTGTGIGGGDVPPSGRFLALDKNYAKKKFLEDVSKKRRIFKKL